LAKWRLGGEIAAMKILALDFGQKRIGVALSDATHTLAAPQDFLEAQPFAELLKSLKAMITREEIGLILVGVPRNMDGSYGDSATKAREFIQHLKLALTVPIEPVDERLSTVQASRLLQEGGHNTRAQKTKIDSASAAVILQSYLDMLAAKIAMQE
jgi:putative Holliday junction resolvase